MNFLILGDVFGNVGIRMLKEHLAKIVNMTRRDFVIVNGENLAGGFGVTESLLNEVLDCGVDVVTSGNHIWDKKDVFKIFEKERRLLRPANIPSGAPGKGGEIFEKAGLKIGVLNLIGRIFMDSVDCPFRKADEYIDRFKRENVDLVLVDFHAEATSEKEALGYYLDGKISALWGTHTHVPTADEKVLSKGTGYITDVGMTGPYESTIGVKNEIILKRFLQKLPERFKEELGRGELNALLLDIDSKTKKTKSIKRLRIVEDVN